MITVLPIFLKLWNEIRDNFDENFLEESKLNRQLEIFDNWRKNKGIGYLEAVTGFGKTLVSIIAIIKLNIFDSRKTINVIVPSLSLKEDWDDPEEGHIARFKLKNVKVYVVNSYTNYNREWKCDLLVLDEVHNFSNESAENFSKVIEITDYTYLLALSATLNKDQKKFLEDKGITRIGLVTLEEAEKNNWISDFIVYNLPVSLNEFDLEEKEKLDSMFNYYHKFFNHDFKLAMACGSGKKGYRHDKLGWKTGNNWRAYWSKELGWNENMGMNNKYSPVNIAKKANIWRKSMNDRRSYLHKAINKLEMTEQVINKLQMKTIVFSQFTTTCDLLKERLGVDSEVYHSNISTKLYSDKTYSKEIGSAYKVDRKTYYRNISGQSFTYDQLKSEYPNIKKLGEKRLKDRIKARFKNNEFNIILAANSLNEGFDCPDVQLGVIHSGNSTSLVNIQQMGRVLRNDGDKKAIIVNIYVKDSQDEKWVKLRQKSTPKSKIHWINSIDEIDLNRKEEKNIISFE